VCRSKHVEQLKNIEIINSTTRSHLDGYFYTIYVTMHGSMNIKFTQSRYTKTFSGINIKDSVHPAIFYKT